MDHVHVSKIAQHINAWEARAPVRSRMALAAAIELTLALKIWINDATQCTAGTLQKRLTAEGSLLITRLVNSVADPMQKAAFASSITMLVKDSGLDSLLVDLRHQAAHNQLPTFSMLKLAVWNALEWLHQTYWIPQKDKLNNLMLTYQSQISAAFHQIIHIPPPSSLNLNKKKRKREASAATIIENLKLSKVSAEDMRDFVVPVVLKEFIQSKPEYAGDHIWKGILEAFQVSNSRFGCMFLLGLMEDVSNMSWCSGWIELLWSSLSKEGMLIVFNWVISLPENHIKQVWIQQNCFNKMFLEQQPICVVEPERISWEKCQVWEGGNLPLGVVYYDPLCNQDDLTLSPDDFEEIDALELRRDSELASFISLSDEKKVEVTARLSESEITNIVEDIEIFI